MSADSPSTDWIYTLYFAFLGGGLWAAWDATEGCRLRQRLGLMLVWLLFWFFGFKEAIIRVHFTIFVEWLAIAWVGFAPSPGTRVRDAWFRAAAPLLALVVTMLSFNGASLNRALHPAKAVTQAVRNLNTAFSPRLRAQAIARAHVKLQAEELVPASELAKLQGHTMSVFPNDVVAAWADHLDWDPIPVLQSYVAYTPYLDRLDANFLASSKAPQRLLFSRQTVTPDQSLDGRLLAYDEPATTRQMLCRYRMQERDGNWAVLRRSVNRCTASPTLLDTVRVGWAQQVNVPPPPNRHSIVYARISGAAPHGFESLWSFLFKPGIRYIALNGSYYRFVSAQEGDGLLMRSSPGFDYPSGYSLVPQAKTLAISKVGQSLSGTPITIRFYAQNYTAR